MSYFLAAILALAPSYLIRLNLFGLPTTVLEILVGGFLLAAGGRAKGEGFRKIKKLGHINYAIGLFVVAGIISTIFSPEPIKALGLLKAFIIEPVLLFYAILLTIKTPKQTAIVLQGLFWGAVAVSLFGIFQHYSFIHLPLRFWGTGSEVERITSVFDYPNALSLYLGPLIGLFSALWLNNYSFTRHRILSLVGIGVMTIALLMTFSRGSWIAVAITLLWLAARRFGVKKTVWPAIAICLVILLLPNVRQRLTLGLSDPSSSAHLNLLKIGANKIIQSPILGNGLYGFRTTLTQAGYQNPDLINYPHNIFLNFWLETGLLGLISFLWIIYLAYQQHTKKSSVLTLAGSAFILVVLIHGLVDAPYFKNDLAILFWFAISLFYLA